MTSRNGWTPFATSLYESGGIESIAERPVSRNLWTIMKEFKVLPTDPTFQALTGNQVEFIMENMSIDNEMQKMIAKGYDPSDHYKDSDSAWWDTSVDEFDPKGELDMTDEEIAEQVEDLTSEADKEKLRGIIEGSEEWVEFLEEEGIAREKATIENVIQANLRQAQEDASRMSAAGEDDWGKARMSQEEEDSASEFEPMTQEGIEEAFKLFEGEEETETEDSNPDDGWI